MMKLILISISFIFILASCQVDDNSNISMNNSKQILALWDSLTEWYTLDEIDTYPSQLEWILKSNNYIYELINKWISWHTSKQLLDRLSDYDEIKADIYLLNIWANDWLRKMDLDNMQDNIEDIIFHLKKVNPNWKIVFIWMELPIAFWFKYSSDFNSRFEKIADEDEELFYIPFILEWVAWDRNLNLFDWLDPNKDWYTVIANNIYDFLVEKRLISN